ncbi:ATP-binding protein [Bdellovibrio sp. ArHS]|uniref:hybrid sensor histidine kinase/response regulator n=1 Tax=Bdellovibrio sp. ArHS TaxID=1569284 RepID=UPI000A87B74E|nr:ATP-binding protein [Bdellovibrio sp. ArHS]
MKIKLAEKTKRIGFFLIGPLWVALIAGLMHLTQYTSWEIPNPAPFLVLGVILSCYYGGFKPGIITSLLSWLYIAYHLTYLSPPIIDLAADTHKRLVNWGLTLPIVSIAVGLLKARSEAHLQRELTQRRLREEELQSSEERMRAILNSANDAFVAIDINSQIREWNNQAEKTFGWTRDEVLGRSLTEVLIPDDYRNAHLQGLKRFQLTGEGPILNKRIEVPTKHKSNQDISVELTVYPIRQKENLMFGAFLRDITEKKQEDRLSFLQYQVTRILAEESSLKAAVPRLLETLVRGVNWPLAELWLTDKKRQNFYYTDNYCLSSELREKFLTLSHPLFLPKDQGLFPQTEGAAHPLHIVKALKNSDYPRAQLVQSANFQSLLYCPLIDNNEVIGALCFLHDEKIDTDQNLLNSLDDISKHISLFILRTWAEEDLTRLSKDLEIKVQQRTEELGIVNTQLKKEIAEKQILYEQAQTANRLKDEFLATISHELRTPMNVILGHSELLYGEELSESEKQKSIEAIYRNTKAQVHIVSDILDVSRFITGRVQLHLELVDMSEIVAVAVESILPAASAKNIEVKEDVGSSKCYVTGDPTRLQQILWNLLSNAVKFTSHHGKVLVKLERQSSNIVVSVRDSGKGIDPVFLPYVFERFRQEDSSTTRKFGGLGLGLAITKNLVEAHGGTIQASSDGKGLGATFTITLPVTVLEIPEEPTTREPFHLNSLRTPLKGLRILVVDDQPDAQALIRTILKKSGAEPTITSTATEAFKLLIKLKPHVLISDVGMPDKDGYELIGMIRRLPTNMGGGVKAICLTAYAHDEDHKKALDMGFDEHLAKPVEAKQLIRSISKLVGRYFAHH